MKPHVSIVVAVTSKNAAIGNEGRLLVHISDDLKRFKRLTTGHAVIMGRKTYESIGRALPGRPNFIVTRNADLKIPGVTVCTSIPEAIEKAWAEELRNDTSTAPNPGKEIFLIGGSEIYKQGLPHVKRIYLTLVETDLEGDVFFPEYSEFKKVLSREDCFDEKTGLKYSWIDLEKEN